MRATTCIAFTGTRRIAQGALRDVALAVKRAHDACPQQLVLVFDAISSQPLDLNLQGSEAEVLSRLGLSEPAVDNDVAALEAEPPARSGPGRPKLGVTPREVTLLPRHWDWLASQPGGASVALRKLVEHAMRASKDADRRRHARDSTYRFIYALAGNAPGFEAALRALFAANGEGFRAAITSWPPDIGDHAAHLAEPVFDNETASSPATTE